MKDRFTAKPYRVGNSYAVTVPAWAIEAGLIDIEKSYEFSFKKAKKVSA